jgi:hypothetical protein
MSQTTKNIVYNRRITVTDAKFVTYQMTNLVLIASGNLLFHGVEIKGIGFEHEKTFFATETIGFYETHISLFDAKGIELLRHTRVDAQILATTSVTPITTSVTPVTTGVTAAFLCVDAARQCKLDYDKFIQLKNLNLKARSLDQIPLDIGIMRNLVTLDASGTNITRVPKSIAACPALVEINLANTAITDRDNIHIGKATSLNVSGCQFPLGFNFSTNDEMSRLKRLIMHGCQLKSVRMEFAGADFVDLTNNLITLYTASLIRNVDTLVLSDNPVGNVADGVLVNIGHIVAFNTNIVTRMDHPAIYKRE